MLIATGCLKIMQDKQIGVVKANFLNKKLSVLHKINIVRNHPFYPKWNINSRFKKTRRSPGKGHTPVYKLDNWIITSYPVLEQGIEWLPIRTGRG